mmetsp:Transcript_89616/g.252855  ORF Transcript_89616/g.252855 Transcript_89616/m.252855 type:complete len:498 (+) Transcript_89616:98-1591(+)
MAACRGEGLQELLAEPQRQCGALDGLSLSCDLSALVGAPPSTSTTAGRTDPPNDLSECLSAIATDDRLDPLTSEDFAYHLKEDKFHCSSDVIMQMREDQSRCSAEVSHLRARMGLLEQRLLATSAEVRVAAASCHVPLLVGQMPQMRRVSPPACSSLSPKDATVPDIEALSRQLRASKELQSADVEALRRQMKELHHAHESQTVRLEEALDAARTGIAHLARDLHYDKQERQRIFSEIGALAADIGGKVVGPSLDRARIELKAQIMNKVVEETARLEVVLASRIQGMMAVLQNEARHPHGEPTPEAAEDEQLLVDRACETTLREYRPENADGEVRSTKLMLMHFGVFERLTLGATAPEDLVTRPTFRFVQQVIQVISSETGYPGKVPDLPDLKDEKVRFLEDLWLRLTSTLGLQDIEFKGEDVVRCMNRGRTRRFLQLLLIAAAKERTLMRVAPQPQVRRPSPPPPKAEALDDLLPSYVPRRSFIMHQRTASSVLSP